MHLTNSKQRKATGYRNERISHWNKMSASKIGFGWFRNSYHSLLAHHLALLIPSGMRVLELGSGKGDLLNSLEPVFGVGLDFSRSMVTEAGQRHPNLNFVHADAHYPPIKAKFDYIILSDLVNDLWDVQTVLENLSHLTHERTRIVINSYSRLWQIPLRIGEIMGMKVPTQEQNWFTVHDLKNLLKLTGAETIKVERAIILPANIPLVSQILNRFFAKLWPFNQLALTNIIVARPSQSVLKTKESALPSVSIVVPARNEEGNIEDIFLRTPELGSSTELVFIEGHSKDDTYEKIWQEIKRNKDRTASLYKQTGKGKADAVKLGFEVAKGDLLMILDSDLSVPPEDLKRFYEVISKGQADFVNGVRLVYPMEDNAMRSANLLGNKFFSLAFSWVLGQEIKDTLCGTKVIRREDYALLKKHWSELAIDDPFGDFDLLFGATKLCLKIVDMPIRYAERTYGSTNINRWRHGLMLLRMLLLAARRIKFV